MWSRKTGPRVLNRAPRLIKDRFHTAWPGYRLVPVSVGACARLVTAVRLHSKPLDLRNQCVMRGFMHWAVTASLHAPRGVVKGCRRSRAGLAPGGHAPSVPEALPQAHFVIESLTVARSRALTHPGARAPDDARGSSARTREAARSPAHSPTQAAVPPASPRPVGATAHPPVATHSEMLGRNMRCEGARRAGAAPGRRPRICCNACSFNGALWPAARCAAPAASGTTRPTCAPKLAATLCRHRSRAIDMGARGLHHIACVEAAERAVQPHSPLDEIHQTRNGAGGRRQTLFWLGMVTSGRWPNSER